jgi:GT2 family glycosyltransferase
MPIPVDAGNLRSELEPSSPSVTVIIPAFKASAHIGAALESVFAQSFADYEVILANDGSPDTDQLEYAIQPYLSRIVYLTQTNQGPSAARNLAIRHARGEWLAFLDSDDTWLPHYLAEQMRFLNENPDLDMVYCDATLEGATGSAGKTFMEVCPSHGPVSFESVLLERTQVPTSGTVVRRQKVTKAGMFDEELRCSEDHDLWLRILHAHGKAGYQRQVLVRRNVRADSQGSDSAKLKGGEMQSLIKLSRTLPLSPDESTLLAERLRTIQAAMDLRAGKRMLLAGDTRAAVELLRRACEFAPNAKLRAILVALRLAPHLTVLVVRFWRRTMPERRQA